MLDLELLFLVLIGLLLLEVADLVLELSDGGEVFVSCGHHCLFLALLKILKVGLLIHQKLQKSVLLFELFVEVMEQSSAARHRKTICWSLELVDLLLFCYPGRRIRGQSIAIRSVWLLVWC